MYCKSKCDSVIALCLYVCSQLLFKLSIGTEFYMKILLCLMQIKGFRSFEDLCKNVIFILNCNDQNETCESIRMKLLSNIQQNCIFHHYQAVFQEQNEFNVYDKTFNTLSDETNFIFNHFLNIQRSFINAVQSKTFQLPNPYYNNEFSKFFLQLLSFFPLWTNFFMPENFNLNDECINTKIYLEKSVEELTLDTSGSCSMKSFLMKHSEILKKSLHNGENEINKFTREQKNLTKKKTNSDHSYLNLFENWRGKVDEDRKDIPDEIVLDNFEKNLTSESSFLNEHNYSKIVKGSNNINANVENEKIDSFIEEIHSSQLQSQSTPIKERPDNNEELPIIEFISTNTSKPSQAKFCQPNPAIEAFYNKHQSRLFKEILILNGSKLLPLTYKSKKYSFSNTSSFDAFVELINLFILFIILKS